MEKRVCRDRAQHFQSARVTELYTKIISSHGPEDSVLVGMKDDQNQFLSLVGQPPARLTVEQAAWFLGFSDHEIPILASKGLLKPLGHPANNGPKYFLAATLQELRRDEKWFSKASDAIVEYWRHKNSRKGNGALAEKGKTGKGETAPEVADVAN